MAGLSVLAQRLSVIAAGLPVGSDVARDVREALNKIAKHVPPGGVSQGVEMSEAQKMLMQTRQAGPQMMANRAAQPAQPGGGQPPMQQAAA